MKPHINLTSKSEDPGPFSKFFTGLETPRNLDIDFQPKLEVINQNIRHEQNILVDIGLSSFISLILPILFNITSYTLFEQYISPRSILTLSILLIIFTGKYFYNITDQKYIFGIFYISFIVTLFIFNIVITLHRAQDQLETVLQMTNIFKNDFVCIIIFTAYILTRFSVDFQIIKYVLASIFILSSCFIISICLCCFTFNLLINLVLQQISYILCLVILIYINVERNNNEQNFKEKIAQEIHKETESLNKKLQKVKQNIQKPYQSVSQIVTSQADLILKKLKYLKYQLALEKENLQKNQIIGQKQQNLINNKKIKNSQNFGNISENETILLQKVETYEIATEQKKVDEQEKWCLSVEDVDQIMNTFVQQHFGIWLPNFLTKNGTDKNNKKKAYISKEGEDFVLNHFTTQFQQLLQRQESQTKIGINLDYRVLENSPIGFHLNQIGLEWNIDYFVVEQLSKGNCFQEFGAVAFAKYRIIETLNTDNKTVATFLKHIQNMYVQKNPYHNAIHAVDVASSICFFTNKGLGSHLSNLDISCLIISSLAHDIGHPGLNNAFLIASQSKQALVYNDQSILENFHVAAFFNLMTIDQCNILRNLSQRDWKYFRKMAINVILDTDLQKHFVILNKFKNSLALGQFNISDEQNKQQALSIAIKCADVGHGAKALKLHKVWSRRIVEEFYIQGDLELKYKMPLSPLCDRSSNIISKSQEGFLKCIVLPLFESWDEFFQSELIQNVCTNQVRKNIEYWSDEIEKEENGKSLFLQETQDNLQSINYYSNDSDSASIISNFV